MRKGRDSVLNLKSMALRNVHVCVGALNSQFRSENKRVRIYFSCWDGKDGAPSCPATHL